MPTQEVHVSWITSLLAFLAMAVSYLFEVPSPVVLAGFLGTLAGLGFSRTVGWVSGFGIVIFGCLAAGYATPLLVMKFGAYSARGIAFFTSFILIGFRVPITKALNKYISRKGDTDA